MGFRKSEEPSYKSEGQIKRESFDYRKAYLKHNPGILGGIYVCSQCGKIMSRSSMQVDHIVPIANKFSINRVINCVSICPRCNKIKSDRIDKKFIIKGIIFKILEELVVLIQNIILLFFRLLAILFILLLRLMVTPLKSERSLYQKALIVGCYSLAAIILIGLV